jgi:O-antigen/teichoic acid export membrane protein
MGVVLIVLSVRWTAPVLGGERFGVWVTFSSFAAMLSFLDLGVGNALVNRVAHTAARQDSRQLSIVIMGGIFWLATIGFAAAALLATIGASIQWTSLFRLTSRAIGDETQTAALVYAGLFGLNILASGLLKILMGQQRYYEAQMIAATAAALACPVVWWTARHTPSIGALLLAGLGTQSLITLIFVLGILHRRGTLDWRLGLSSMTSERKVLLTSGVLFLFLQIGTMIGWGADNFLVAGIVGASGAASFGIAQRLFLFASQPVSILNGSLWAAYADAQAKGDRRFIRDTLVRAFLLSIAVSIGASVALLMFGRWVVAFWTENSVAVPWQLLVAFAVWTPLESAGTVLSVYLNGTGIVREQIVVVFCFCAVAVPAKILAATHAGAVGLVVSTTVAYAVVVMGLYGGIYRKRILAPIRAPRGESNITRPRASIWDKRGQRRKE